MKIRILILLLLISAAMVFSYITFNTSAGNIFRDYLFGGSSSEKIDNKLEREASRGNLDSMYALAMRLSDTCALDPDLEKQGKQRRSFDLLRVASDKGHRLASLKVACIYALKNNIAGTGDIEKSRKYIELVINDPKSSVVEIALAKVQLASTYNKSPFDDLLGGVNGVKSQSLATSDPPQACALYKEAFKFAPKESGRQAAYCESEMAVERGDQPDEKRIIEFLNGAGAAGDVLAYLQLGASFLNSGSSLTLDILRIKGVAYDPKNAVKYLAIASDLGSSEAKYLLARLYLDGEGAAKDYKMAAQLFYESANDKYIDSQLELARLYALGVGVGEDKVKALAWLSLAVNEVSDDRKVAVKKFISALERRLSSVDQYRAQSMTRDWRAGNIPLGDEVIAAKEFFGTGFVVSTDGVLVTNAHVVRNCTHITVGRGRGSATIIGTDVVNDLALLRSEHAMPVALPIRSGSPAKLGESVVVFGFPLAELLASNGNLVEGTVSATVGYKNNAKTFQISAPIQPGNSGAPVFDRQGNVIGIVVSKLDAISVARATKDIPQNVNFAIHTSPLRSLLDVYGINYSAEPWFSLSKSAEKIANRVRASVWPIECRRK